jgi:hypothetical protein
VSPSLRKVDRVNTEQIMRLYLEQIIEFALVVMLPLQSCQLNLIFLSMPVPGRIHHSRLTLTRYQRFH